MSYFFTSQADQALFYFLAKIGLTRQELMTQIGQASNTVGSDMM